MAFLLLVLLLFEAEHSIAQQSYVNNKQLDCDKNHTTTLGFVCNGAASTCTSYLTFRSTPTYNNPITIAYLLSADASQIAASNNISDVELIPADTLVLVPVNCSCSQNYYQHNASYILKNQEVTAETETYFTVANGTYQALTTCQSMEAQNPYNYRRLYPDMRLTVPLRCACPTRNQTTAGFNYLLTYLIRQGDSYNSIADAFSAAGADVQGILDANRLSVNDLIFFFTPILVPLKIQPTKANINTVAAPPPPSNFHSPAAPPNHSGGSNSGKWIFIGVGIGAAALFLLSSVLLYLLCYRRRQHKKSPSPPPKLFADKSRDPAAAGPPFSDWSVSSQSIRSAIESLTVYKYEDLDKATSSFAESNRIDGSSSVYLGSFKGDNAVIKIMKGDVSREINALRQINHSHIIRLSGFCLHHDITYLVYEYAEKGSLAECLRPNSNKLQNKDSNDKHMNIISISERRLDWKQRLQIAYDVADALNYLHNFTNPPYIHKNLKSSNILLDGNLRTKIADFALSRTLDTDDQNVMTRHVVGTYGYMAPEYIESGLITPKLDVFAFGVVMLELLSGREPIVDDDVGKDKNKEGSHQMLLLSERIEGVLCGESVREKLKEFVDPWLGEEYPLEVAYSMAELARRCVAHNIEARPNVSDVFVALSKLLSSSLDWDPSHDTSLSFSDRES